MKKTVIWMMGLALLMSSCGSYTATGAYTGGQFGHIIGSAIGGITGGGRGHDLGSLVGTVGGVAAGAAIGSAVDHAQQRKYEQRVQSARQQRGGDDSGFDAQGRGDDRVDFGLGRGYTQDYQLEIRNARLADGRRDGILRRGDECRVVFDIMNNSNQVVYDVHPVVEETTGNKHIHVSRNLTVEQIAPHQGVRYTANIKADRGLKSGQIAIRVSVAGRVKQLLAEPQTFRLTTSKR